MSKDKLYTLIYVLKDDVVLLGMKKRGFGVGRWNGFGGKVMDGEDIAAGAKRYERHGEYFDLKDSLLFVVHILCTAYLQNNRKPRMYFEE